MPIRSGGGEVSQVHQVPSSVRSDELIAKQFRFYRETQTNFFVDNFDIRKIIIITNPLTSTVLLNMKRSKKRITHVRN